MHKSSSTGEIVLWHLHQDVVYVATDLIMSHSTCRKFIPRLLPTNQLNETVAWSRCAKCVCLQSKRYDLTFAACMPRHRHLQRRSRTVVCRHCVHSHLSFAVWIGVWLKKIKSKSTFMNVFFFWWHFMTQLATRLYSRLLWHPVNLYYTVLSCVQCHYLLFKSSSAGCQRCKCIVFGDSIKTSLPNLVLNTTSRKTGRCYQITMCHTIRMPLIQRSYCAARNRHCCFSHCVYSTPICFINVS